MLQVIALKTGSGQTVQAQICQMQQNHVDDFEGIWRDILRELGQDDAFWSWATKKRLSVNDDRFEAYAIEYEGLTQGLLWLETRWHRSWLPQRYPLVYVEALASAPWNRKSLEDPPYLYGVGTALLLFARQRSLALGYAGRVGLHALPASEEFYRQRNMMASGQDPDRENLRYFEYGRLLQSVDG
ncbi:hypothetical protein [Leptolyngbya sp. FACHB-711]|uniref:hypothetical protein n=1 Tax=Leptolyngbya sp. FACHB-711 TaxID=2692813 RepID=UPI001683A874|nr:hypothetical protein [Leptolyngbya sp. FACHB-711]MBD2024211.1 hypothetical protein [Leptolyngbya sp. FACHB-711]